MGVSFSTLSPDSRLLGLPQMPASKDDECGRQRILELLRPQRPNQIVKAVKQRTPELSKLMIRQMNRNGMDERTARDRRHQFMVSLLYASSFYRQQLILKEWQLQAEQECRHGYLPILEYAALRAWFPDFVPPTASALQAGLAGQEPISSLYTTGPLGQPDSQGLLSYLQHDDAMETIHRVRQMTSWLAPYGDQMLIDLDGWERYRPAQQLDLVSAIFAACVLSGGVRQLAIALDAQPDIARYLAPVRAATRDPETQQWLPTAIDWHGSTRQRPGRALLPLMTRILTSLRDFGEAGYEALPLVERMQTDVERLMQRCRDGQVQVFDAIQRAIANSQLQQTLEGYQKILLEIAEEDLVAPIMAILERWRTLACKGTEYRLIELTACAGAGLETLLVALDQLSQRMQRLAEVSSAYDQAMRDSLALPLMKRAEALRPHEAQAQAALEAVRTFLAGNPFPEAPEADELICQRQEEKARYEALSEQERRLPPDLRHLLKQMESRAQTAEDEAELLIHKQSQLLEEIERQRQLVNEYEIQIEALRGHFDRAKAVSGGSDADARQIIETVQAMVQSDFEPVPCLQALSEMYPDRLRFLPSAIDSASQFSDMIPGRALFERLSVIATTGLDALRNSARLIELQDLVPGELSVNESQTVRHCDKLSRHRQFRDGNIERTIFTHLALDYRTRLYFEYDEAESRIIVGYVGQHLPTKKAATV